MTFTAGGTANPNLNRAGLAFDDMPLPKRKMTWALWEKLNTLEWAPQASYIVAPSTAIYAPIFYLPAAFALGFAHVLNYGPYAAIIAARIVNGLCFVALGFVALLIARRGEGVLFVTLCLPMTLFLAASCNQDALLIATSALAAALLTRCTAPEGRNYIFAASALAAVMMAKMAYLPLAASLLIPVRLNRNVLRNGNLWRALCVVSIAMVPALVWNALATYYVAVPFQREPYHPGPLWPGDPATVFQSTDPGAQVRILLHSPALILTLPLDQLTSSDALRSRLLELVGLLARLDLRLPLDLYRLWYLALAFSIVGCLLHLGRLGPSVHLTNSAIGLTAVFSSVIAVLLSQYLIWSPVGAPSIIGVQGRYGLPLLAMFAPTLPAIRLPLYRMNAVLKCLLIAPAIAAAGAGLVLLPQLVLVTYYMR